MIRSSQLVRAIAIGLGLTVTALVAPIGAGAMDMSGARPMMGAPATPAGVQTNVANLEARLAARVAEIRMSLMGQ